jgi:hypothetical protein
LVLLPATQEQVNFSTIASEEAVTAAPTLVA